MTSDRASNASSRRSIARWLGGIIGVLLVLVLVLVGRHYIQRGGLETKVTLTNSGSQPLMGVVLHVSGQSYDVGTIPAGETVVVLVAAKYDSHLEVEYSSEGKSNRVDVGGYFGPDIQADYAIDMDAGGIRSCSFGYR